MASKVKFETNQQILVRAVVGPSGVSEAGTSREGIFVRVNTDDPEVWVALSDVVIITPEIKKLVRRERSVQISRKVQ